MVIANQEFETETKIKGSIPHAAAAIVTIDSYYVGYCEVSHDELYKKIRLI